MDTNVPYMPSVANLSKILDGIQKAGVPETFNLDFLKDLGFTSSNDRPVIKLLKYLGMLDASGRPQTPYRDFVDHTKAKIVLADRLRSAFDDLFLADTKANEKPVEQLRGWFKSKTGVSDSVATKLATQFKALADYSDFKSAPPPPPPKTTVSEAAKPAGAVSQAATGHLTGAGSTLGEFGLVYRLEIHLPDTQNIETFRAIFRALREEMIR